MTRILLILTAALLAALAAPVVALAELNVPATLSALGSDDYATRQRATESLLADDSLTPQDVEKLYAAATLPEQRNRVLDVARHHFIRRIQEPLTKQGGAGSMGLMIGAARGAEQFTDMNRTAARISVTYPGFPAYVYMRPGDLVVSVDDQLMPSTADDKAIRKQFIALVQKHRAGETVRLGVYRDGKTISVTLPLASFNALTLIYEPATTLRPSAYPRLHQPYEAQWTQYRRELTADESAVKPLRVNLDAVPAAPVVPGGGEPAHLNQQPAEEPAPMDED